MRVFFIEPRKCYVFALTCAFCLRNHQHGLLLLCRRPYWREANVLSPVAACTARTGFAALEPSHAACTRLRPWYAGATRPAGDAACVTRRFKILRRRRMPGSTATTLALLRATRRRPPPRCRPAAANAPLYPNGAGALELTPPINFQDGFVFYAAPLSTSNGLSATFNYYSYNANGNPGDGLAFVMTDASKPAPTGIGGCCGSLGYAPVCRSQFTAAC